MQDPSYGKPLQNYIDFDDIISEQMHSTLFPTSSKNDLLDFLHEYNKEYGHIPQIPTSMHPYPCTLKKYIDLHFCICDECTKNDTDSSNMRGFKYLSSHIFKHLKRSFEITTNKTKRNGIKTIEEYLEFNGYGLTRVMFVGEYFSSKTFKIKKL